jgi:hypothetical protein
MRKWLQRLCTTVAACGALLVSAGCGASSGTAGTTPTEPPSTATATAEGSQTATLSAPAQAAEAACTAALKRHANPKTTRTVDQTFRYVDGLSIQMLAVHTSKVAPYASGAYPGEPLLVMTLRLTNRTKAPIDTSSLQLLASYDDAHLDRLGGAEIAEVTDNQTLDMPNPIPRNQAASNLHEFLVPPRCVSRVIVQVATDPHHRPVRFAVTKH